VRYGEMIRRNVLDQLEVLVAGVRRFEHLAEAGVDALAVAKATEAPVILDAAILVEVLAEPGDEVDDFGWRGHGIGVRA